MIKRIICSMLIFILVFMLVTPVYAKNVTRTIDITVMLKEDGSADVFQTWMGNFDVGSQCALKIDSKNDKNTITNLKVFDGEGNQYELVQSWNEKGSLASKKEKYALLVKDYGFDICWGISEYGENIYNINYTITDLVSAYNDFDGFNFRFLPKDMDNTPTKVQIAISHYDGKKITQQNCTVKTTGYNGKTDFKDGLIHSYTTKDIGKKDHLTVMMKFEKGMFTPLQSYNDTFENAVEKPAEKGKDYGDKDKTVPSIIIILAAVLLMIIIVVAAVRGKIKKSKKKAEDN